MKESSRLPLDYRLLQALAECWPLLANPEEGADA